MRTLLPPRRVPPEPQKDALGESALLHPVSADLSRPSHATDALPDETPLLPRVWQDLLSGRTPTEPHGRASEGALRCLQHLPAELSQHIQLPAAPGDAPQGSGPLPSRGGRERTHGVLGLGRRSGCGDGGAEQAGSTPSVSYPRAHF